LIVKLGRSQAAAGSISSHLPHHLTGAAVR
jgi:hypothetical protein